jgi:hypothetical protein
MRDEQNANLHKREELRKIGQLGKLIKRLTCNPPNKLDLPTLPYPSGRQIADDYFQGWSAIPTDLDSAATRLATDPVWHSAINADITYKHFDEAISELKTGSAPGPSRVTANIIKAWPRSTKIFV